MSSSAFTLTIVASYIFTLLSGSLLLIAGLANYQLSLGNSFPDPGMFPLMASSPYGGGIMYPMMISNPLLLKWTSIIGIITGSTILGTGILLYTYSKYQMIGVP